MYILTCYYLASFYSGPFHVIKAHVVVLQIGIITTKNKRAEKLTDLSGELISIHAEMCSRHAEMQLLQLCMRLPCSLIFRDYIYII